MRFQESQPDKWEISFDTDTGGSLRADTARELLRMIGGILWLLDHHYSEELSNAAAHAIADNLRPAALLLLKGAAHKQAFSEQDIIDKLITDSQQE